MLAFFPVPFRILNMEFPVKIVPGGQKDEIAGPLADGTLAVGLRATGHRDDYDTALRALLARHYHVPRSAIRIWSGETPNRRCVRIAVSQTARPRLPQSVGVEEAEAAVAGD